MDPSILLLRHYRRRITVGDDAPAAYKFVTENFANFFDIVRNRALNVGHIAPNVVGQFFLHRNELILAGLHTEQTRGICVGFLENGREVATCVVATYPLHNFDEGDGIIHYGGEGGRIGRAHRLHMRVLNDQDENSTGNKALHHCSVEPGALVRVIVGGLNKRPYQYRGLYRVLYWEELDTEQGRTVYEYTLQQAQQ